MTLLWTQAMAWWTGHPDFDYEEGLRDVSEPAAARRARYVSRIVDRHNVSREDAAAALDHVTGHLREGSPFRDVREYGFLPSNRQEENWPQAVYARLRDPATWEHRPVVQVPSEEIRATQDFIRPSSVAHNFFHPGHHQGRDHDAVGDPDFDPRDDADEDDGYSGTREDMTLNGTAKFLHHDDGSWTCLDGHHRTGADMLLGKEHVPGQVISERELRGFASGSRSRPEPAGHGSLMRHLREDHGWSTGDVARASSSVYERRKAEDQHELEHDFRDPGHYHEED